MISAISTPAAGAVMLDANNTVIVVQSTNGTGYYFRAIIRIDGAIFDEQSWSRSDAYTASKDIKKIYSAYISPAFNDAFDTVLQEHTAFKKRVNITINEYSLATGEVVETVDLPEFFILYNIKPVPFNHQDKIRLLGMNAAVMVIPPAGKVVVPFYVNAAAEALTVTLNHPNGNTIVSQGLAAFTGKKCFLFKYNLAAAAIAYGVTHLTIAITLGAAVQTVVYRLNHLPDYPFKEIAFRNNFGHYLYAYPDGELEIVDALDVDTYEQEDGTENVAEISEEATYTINTGSYRTNEKAIMNMIANSPDAWLLSPLSFAEGPGVGPWLRLLPQTKKLNSFTDRKHVYNNDLLFKVYKDAAVANTGLLTVPLYPDIVVTGIAVDKRKLTINFNLNNGFAPQVLQLQVRPVGSTVWDNLIIISPPVSPYIITFNNNYPYPIIQVRVVEYNNPANASNITTVAFTV